MKTLDIFLPKTIGWLLRTFDIPGSRWTIGRDPVLFAQWYAIVGEVLDWPEEAKAIAETERAKKIGIELLTSILGKLWFATNGLGAERTRALMEGYAVHAWVEVHWSEFYRSIETAKTRILPLVDTGSSHSEYSKRVKSLGEVLALDQLQVQILEFAFMCGVANDFSTLMRDVAKRFKGRENIWTTLFQTTKEELMAALHRDSALFKSGVLEPHTEVELVRVNRYWVESFSEPHGTFEECLIERLPVSRTSGTLAVLADPDMNLAVDILKGSGPTKKGVNLLLYGASSLDKTHVLDKMLTLAGKEGWRIKFDADIPKPARKGVAYVAFQILKKYPSRVLVIEKPDDILEVPQGHLFSMLFGIELEPALPSKADEMFLSNFTTPAVWLLSDTKLLSPDAVARFVFHAPLKKADRLQRQAQVQTLLLSSTLGKRVQEKIIRLDGVSALQIDSALVAAKLAGAKRGKQRDEAVLQAIQRSQKALGRDLTEKFKGSVTEYSLKYLNCSGRFGPDQIKSAMERSRRGTMVCYGLPGTGKTQFVEHLAASLGMPLISKRASELMDKYVGDNEKNIANMFEEAANEDAMLLLDEGDSFLRDRSFARAQWEVTMVNELLQHMERFPGIFVVCTNLFEGLDAAALRRFTFKLEFNELTLNQRWEMFLNETGLRAQADTISASQKEEWWEKLAFMQLLAAGDFATVQRQCQILNVKLTPDEWLTQLEMEVKVKKKRNFEPELG